jgi:hypothetical protein
MIIVFLERTAVSVFFTLTLRDLVAGQLCATFNPGNAAAPYSIEEPTREAQTKAFQIYELAGKPV